MLTFDWVEEDQLAKGHDSGIEALEKEIQRLNRKCTRLEMTLEAMCLKLRTLSKQGKELIHELQKPDKETR